MPKKKMSPGWLIGLTIGSVVLVLALIHIAIAVYFLRAKFEIREVEYSDDASVAASPQTAYASDAG